MKILLAADDEHFGEAIADFAVRNVRLAEAEVRIITVIPSLLAYTSLAVVPDLMQEMRDETRKTGAALVHKLNLHVKDAFPNASVEEYVVEGQPADEILSMAEKWNADLILVGSHGRRGLNRLVIGSVSQAVLSHSSCPVLVVKLRHNKKGSEKLLQGTKDNIADYLAART